jgi:hypothetical protein
MREKKKRVNYILTNKKITFTALKPNSIYIYINCRGSNFLLTEYLVRNHLKGRSLSIQYNF